MCIIWGSWHRLNVQLPTGSALVLVIFPFSLSITAYVSFPKHSSFITSLSRKPLPKESHRSDFVLQVNPVLEGYSHLHERKQEKEARKGSQLKSPEESIQDYIHSSIHAANKHWVHTAWRGMRRRRGRWGEGEEEAFNSPMVKSQGRELRESSGRGQAQRFPLLRPVLHGWLISCLWPQVCYVCTHWKRCTLKNWEEKVSIYTFAKSHPKSQHNSRSSRGTWVKSPQLDGTLTSPQAHR